MKLGKDYIDKSRRARFQLLVDLAVISWEERADLSRHVELLDLSSKIALENFIKKTSKINVNLSSKVAEMCNYDLSKKKFLYNEENQTQIFYFSNTNEEVMTKNVQVGAGKLGFSEEELAYFSNKNEIKKVMTNNNFAAQDKAIAQYNNQFVSGQYDDGSDRDLINILNEYRIGDAIGEEARGALFADLIKWKTGESVNYSRFSGEFAAQNRAIDEYNSNFDGGSDGY